MRINKHTAWIKRELMKEYMGNEWAEEWSRKYKLPYNEPQPKLERHRHDIYYRGRKNLVIWHMSRPRIKFYWPFKWPVKVFFNITKEKRSR